MKKILTLAAAMIVAATAYGQGTVNFINKVPSDGIDAKITLNGAGVQGPNFVAQLFAGPKGTAEGSLVAVGTPVAFFQGAGAGYFNGQAVTVNNVAPGAAATVEVKAWDSTTGATFAAATTKGASGTFDLAALGGAGQPPSLPANLKGMTPFSLSAVPEPSTIALGILGAAALLIRRRK